MSVGLYSFGMNVFKDSQISPILKLYDDREWKIPATSDVGSTITLSSGQLYVIGLRILPPLKWNGTLEQFVELFDKYTSYLVFKHQLDYNNVVLPQIISNIDANMKDNLMDIEGFNDMLVKKIDNGLFIGTIVKLDVSSLHKNHILSLTISLSVALDKGNSQATSKHKDDIDKEERDVRQLLERHRYRPPKISPREVKLPVKLLNPISITSESREISPYSSIVMITIANMHPTKPILVHEIVLRLGMSIVNNDKFIENIIESYNTALDGAVDDDRADQVTVETQSITATTLKSRDEYIVQESDICRVDEHVYLEQLLPSHHPTDDVRNRTIPVSETYNYVYKFTIKNKFGSEIVAKELFTPILVKWSESGTKNDMISEYDLSWSIGTNYISSDYKTNLVQENLINKDYFDGSTAVAKDHTVRSKVMVCIDGPSTCKLHELVNLNINIMNMSKRPLKKLILGLGSGNSLEVLGDSSLEYMVRENMLRLPELPISESINATMRIVPLKSGVVKLDNFFVIEESECDDTSQPTYFQHAYSLHVI